MDGGLILFGLFFLFFLIAGPILGVAAFLRSRNLKARMDAAESRIRDLERSAERAARAAPVTAAAPDVTAVRVQETSPAVPAPSATEAGTIAEPLPAPPQAEPRPKWRPKPKAPQALPVEAAAAATPVSPPHSAPLLSGFSQATSQGASGQAEPAADSQKAALSLEELLGTNILAKVGIAILVLGVTFMLVWQVREMGPAGKVMVGWLTGLAMLGAGVFSERNERYVMLARAAVGGGWALLFFVAYAMYHVNATRVLSTPLQSLLVMLPVAGAMVGHTLRYRSQVVTGLAFLLAFFTTAVNRADVYSLAAGCVLAAALVPIVLRMKWFELEVFGILAVYLNHYYWLRSVIEPMGENRAHFPEYYASATLLLVCWAIFRASYLLRGEAASERISTLASLLTSLMLLSVLRYQSVDPRMAFPFLLALGTAEFVLGQFARKRGQRMPFVVLSTLGSALLLAAIPFRVPHFTPFLVSAVWLAQSQALFHAGTRTREVVFVRLGMAASIAAMMQMLAVPAARVVGARMDGGSVVFELSLGALFAVAALAFYFIAHVAPRRRPDLFEHGNARAARAISYVGGGMCFAAAYVAFPSDWTAVAWMAVSLLLARTALQWNFPELTLQANALAALAFLRILFINLPSTDTLPLGGWEPHARILTIPAVAAMLYFGSRWGRASAFEFTKFIPDVFTWAASACLALLAWYELRTASVALAWALFGVVLYELGLMRQSLHLRLQGYVAMFFALVRVFTVNLNAGDSPDWLGPRVYTVIPIAAAFFYLHERVATQAEEPRFADQRRWVANLAAWMGGLCVAAVIRFEAQLDWVGAAWAATSLGLAALAWRSGRRVFLHQAMFMSLASCFRSGTHNLYERSYFPAPAGFGPSVTIITAVILLLLSLFFAFRMRIPEPAGGGWRGWLRAVDHRPEQLLFFFPVILLTFYLGVEYEGGSITIAWGFQAVAVFIFALVVRERSYRLTGLALLLLCIGKIGLVDWWKLGMRDRALTFLAIGGSVSLVSILYSRNRERLRKYL